MNQNELTSVLQSVIDSISEVLQYKGNVYTDNVDRLSNFKHVAKILQCEPEQALLGMVAKHISALVKFINKLPNVDDIPEKEWDEKIIDIINYMILLKALLVERQKEQKNA